MDRERKGKRIPLKDTLKSNQSQNEEEKQSNTVTSESSTGIKQILFFPIGLKETGLSRNLKSNADFELGCISEALRTFLIEQTETQNSLQF